MPSTPCPGTDDPGSLGSMACDQGKAAEHEDEQAMLAFTRAQWQAVLDALDGDEASRDTAYDAIQRSAPDAWLEAQE